MWVSMGVGGRLAKGMSQIGIVCGYLGPGYVAGDGAVGCGCVCL